MPRHPPNPFYFFVKTILDAAEDRLRDLFPHLSAPQPPGPTHKRSRTAHPSRPPQRPTARPKTPPPPPKPPLPPLPDHYLTLGVHPSAPQTVIQASYRALARLYHPDIVPGQKGKEKAEEKMRRINAAYEVLRDPVRREAYDFERRKRGL